MLLLLAPVVELFELPELPAIDPLDPLPLVFADWLPLFEPDILEFPEFEFEEPLFEAVIPLFEEPVFDVPLFDAELPEFELLAHPVLPLFDAMLLF